MPSVNRGAVIGPKTLTMNAIDGLRPALFVL